ncbi:MBL fold metallo-hydrolase [Sphingomonas sp. 28-62-11]|uniref:MBL fold metallo-hydrolase n=1 Tax=Sphingomonas sp. 28-62-11 TaxID=1970432 RepID=UPI000BD80D40|nr:MAG: MBL fold metallo-hydrolase [Sphingomonas sp. 28-62-11]
MKRLIGIVALLLGLLAGGAYLMRDRIALALFERGMAQVLATDPFAGRPDGLGVALCGAGSPMPSPDRAGPCTVITAGRHVYLVDIGEGGVRNLGRMGYGAGRVEAVFLTHFHSDHIDSLGALMLQHWGTSGSPVPLPVYGPIGVETVVGGFNAAYSLDRGYRIAHHGTKVMQPAAFGMQAFPQDTPANGDPRLVFAKDGLQVFAFRVDHSPVEPAYGYIFAYKGRRIVVSGDTKPTASVERAAKGADVLVHEALSDKLVGLQQAAATKADRPMLARIFHDIPTYHTTPTQAADIAQRAGVKMLLLTHIVPPLPYSILEGPFLSDARSRFKGPLVIGHDGTEILLPAGSTAIEQRRRF